MANKIAFDLKFESNGKKVMGELAIDSKRLAEAMATVNKQTSSAVKSFSDWGFAADAVDQLKSAVGGMGSIVTDAVSQFESFDKSMRAANTMAGKSGKEFEALKDQVKELSKEVPVARDELANGLYQVISNGVPEGNWLDFLETSARSSVGGIADLGQTVTVTSTILKNYAMDWEKAGEIQDKIQLTAKNGVTSFEQLAGALPRVSGSASDLGVSIDELMASFATLTGVSGNTAEVSTQLAAIFTALKKPSSEASKLADQMGIRFDAAAIKAAGGFKNFLDNLKQSVSAYSAASGELEQTVMARLFGSAESLRALGPLMGNLSEKFGENIGAMTESAGTMDVAFEEMSQTADASRQAFQNVYAAVMDNVGAIGSVVGQMLQWTAVAGQAAVGASKLAIMIKSLNLMALVGGAKMKVLSAGLLAYGVVSGKSAVAQKLLNSSMAQGAISGTALSVAIRGLLISTGVGAALVALGFIINKLMSSSDEAAESIDGLQEAESEFIRVAAQEKVSLENEAKSLKLLISSTDDASGAVKRLNSQYGDVFGKHKTAAEWYDVLTKKSAAYAEMLGYEAQMKILASQKAEKELEYDKSRRDQAAWMKNNRKKWHERRDPEGMSYYTSNDKEFKAFEKRQRELRDEIDETDKKYGDAMSRIEQIQRQYDIKSPAKESALVPDVPDGGKDGTKDKRTRLQKLNDLIADGQKRYVDASESEREEIRKNIAKWEDERRVIGLLKMESERPADLNSIKDFNDEIAYQRKLREYASKENIAGIDEEIKRLEGLRKALERSGHVEVPIDKIETYDQLNAELAYYNAELTAVGETERQTVQQHINDLMRLKEKWDEMLAELEKPGDISTLNSIEDLDKAISYYQQRQKRASAEEILDIQRTIDELEKKRSKMESVASITSIDRDLRVAEGDLKDLGSLEGRDLTVRLKAIGIDRLKADLDAIDRMIEAVSAQMELVGADSDQGKVLQSQLEGLRSLRGEMAGYVETAEQNAAAGPAQAEALQTLTGAFGQLGGAIGGAAGEWLSYGANVIAAVQQALPAILQLITQQQAQKAANAEAAATGAASSVASIPFVGPALAVAAIASVIAAIAGIPKFAKGGIAYGPTLGLFGEYAGAANNPEVVAPLSDLRSMLEPREQMAGRVEFEIDGTRLRGVLNRVNRRSARS